MENVSTKANQAIGFFKNGYNCAQSLLMAFASEAGIEEQMAYRMASGLGGGVGQTRNICGAINAGAIVLSLKFGKIEAHNVAARSAVAKLIGKFVGQCQEVLGNTQCDDLLQINPNDTAAKREVGEKPSICVQAVIKTTEILEQFLAMELPL